MVTNIRFLIMIILYQILLQDKINMKGIVMLYFLKGFIMGFTYVAPIGMQNMFVINGALNYKKKHALLVGLIVTFFDITLAFSCFYGIGTIIEYNDLLRKIVLLVGSITVMYIGISLFLAKPEHTIVKQKHTDFSIVKIIISAFVVTWFNPQALIDGTLMLGAFRVSLPIYYTHHFIVGIACASLIWFNGLTIIVLLFGNFIKGKVLRYINLFCGGIIIIYGVGLMVKLIHMLF